MCITHYTVTTYLCGDRKGQLGGVKGRNKHILCDRMLNLNQHGSSTPVSLCPAKRKRHLEQVLYPCEGCVEVGRWRMNTEDGSWIHTPLNVVTTVDEEVDSLWLGQELDAPVQEYAEVAEDVPQQPAAPDNTDNALAAAMGKTLCLDKNARAARRRQQVAARKRRLEQRQQAQEKPSWYNPNRCQVCRAGYTVRWCRECGGTGEVIPMATC